MRILLSDPHQITRSGIILLLEKEYSDVVIGEASTPEEMMDKLGSQEWDLLIMAICISEHHAIELVGKIKKTYSKLPVIVTSVYPEERYALHAYKANVSAHICKDVLHLQLVEAIEKAMSGHKFITPSVAEKMAEAFSYDSEKPLHESLSNREFMVFQLLAEGKSVSEITQELKLCTSTITTFKYKIFEKMHIDSNAQLIRYALEHELV